MVFQKKLAQERRVASKTKTGEKDAVASNSEKDSKKPVSAPPTGGSVPPTGGSVTPVSVTPVPDIEGLLDFAVSVDRASPLKFVGRVKELGVFRRNLNSLWKKWTDAKKGEQPFWLGETFLFQGAPGAGKTAVLNHLKKEKVKIPIGDRQANLYGDAEVRVCKLDLEDLENTTEMKRKIARTFFPFDEKDKELAGKKTSRKGSGAGITLGPIHIKWIRGEINELPASVWEDITSEVRNNPDGHCPVLVMVDEAQNLDDEASEALDFLHQGNHGLPIIPVFGGLAWAVDRLGELGVSRASLKRIYTLGRLSKEECMETAPAFFDEFGVIGTEEKREEWAEMIADECMGWPQHLHAGYQALAEAIAEAKGLLADTDKTTAKEGGKAGRNEYYTERLRSSKLRGADILIAMAVKDCMPGTRPTASSLARVIRDASKKAEMEDELSDDALPEGMTAPGLVDAMIKAGILHEYRPISKKTGRPGIQRVEVPIPSFRDFLLDVLKDWENPAPHRGVPTPHGGGAPHRQVSTISPNRSTRECTPPLRGAGYRPVLAPPHRGGFRPLTEGFRPLTEGFGPLQDVGGFRAPKGRFELSPRKGALYFH